VDRSSTVDPADLYDGPVPADNVEPFPRQPLTFRPPADERPMDPRARAEYVATITAALDVLNARLLGLIATIAACLMWSWAVYEPELLRTYAAIGFSLTVLAPIVLLYWRRG
jgi:hypothetical protein